MEVIWYVGIYMKSIRFLPNHAQKSLLQTEVNRLVGMKSTLLSPRSVLLIGVKASYTNYCSGINHFCMLEKLRKTFPIAIFSWNELLL